MTSSFDRELRFQYPENWQLEEDPATGVPRTISVTAPSGAFWSVTLLLRQNLALDEMLEQYIETLDAEYSGVEQEPITEKIGQLPELDGRDVQFFCLDLLVRSRVLTTVKGPYHLLICWQAEDREFDLLEPVFRAISFSCLSDSPK